MDNKINLNFYGVNYQKAIQEKKEAEEKKDETVVLNKDEKNVNPNEVLSAMALSGAQNKAFAGLNAINPKDYLDDASIARIQNSMAVFEHAFDNYMNIIEAEFPHLSDAQKQALAQQVALKSL